MRINPFAAVIGGLSLTVSAQVLAAADFRITEIYTGLSGNDGTADWFELSNIGNQTGDTGGLYFDDGSADPTVDGLLSSFLLKSGESAVFLIKGKTEDIGEFESVWGTGINVGVTAAGGGLGQSGDSIWIFDGNTASANIIDVAVFDDSFTNQLFTMDLGLDGTIASSSIGLNGAYLSNAFENENFSSADDMVALVGSPGVSQVPVPAAAWLFGSALMGLIGLRRSRR